MRIGIYTNILKDTGLAATKALIAEFSSRKIEFCVDSALSQLSQNACATKDLIKKSDYLIVVGGDGTILNIIIECALASVPVLGVNTGTIGFLTEAEITDISLLADILIDGRFKIDKRYLLKVGYKNKSGFALNEVLIARSGDFRVINFNLFIGESLVDSYAADGFIISSPTGSTAYSLSCGGPILSPHVDALVLTPINPHSLHSRAIVVSDTETARISILNERAGASIVTDGRFLSSLKQNEEVSVTKSDKFASFIRIKETNFYSRLFEKLDIWSSFKKESVRDKAKQQ